MKSIAILGHFAKGRQQYDGQTIKTRIIGNEILQRYGEQDVSLIDTHGGWRTLIKLPWILLHLLANYRNIVIMPAHNGVRLIVPLLTLGNLLFHRSIHYVVIGGWLPRFTKRYGYLRRALHHINGIYVEAEFIANDLRSQSYENIIIMPNTKPLQIIPETELPKSFEAPYRLCTFSRVTKEKGIEYAIQAVNECNKRTGRRIFELDIYGLIEKKDKDWFEALMSRQGSEISYKGTIPYDKSTEVLKGYFALLFPTYYEGECFAGTLIDAMASGLPAIVSDWHENTNIVEDGKTGFIFPTHNVKKLTEILLALAQAPEESIPIRQNCVRKAFKYQPENVLEILTSRFQL